MTRQMPWFRSFPDQNLIETHHLTPGEKAAFDRVRDHIHRFGGEVPDDPRHLAVVTGVCSKTWKRIRNVLLASRLLAASADRRLSCPHISAEIARARAISATRAEAGRSGMAKRRPRKKPPSDEQFLHNSSIDRNGQQKRNNRESNSTESFGNVVDNVQNSHNKCYPRLYGATGADQITADAAATTSASADSAKISIDKNETTMRVAHPGPEADLQDVEPQQPLVEAPPESVSGLWTSCGQPAKAVDNLIETVDKAVDRKELGNGPVAAPVAAPAGGRAVVTRGRGGTIILTLPQFALPSAQRGGAAFIEELTAAEAAWARGVASPEPGLSTRNASTQTSATGN